MLRSTRSPLPRFVRNATALLSLVAAGAVFGSCDGSEPAGPNPSPVVAFANTPDAATVQFGLANVGSGFPANTGHDQSGHAVDTMVPGTVVIDAGGSVTFFTGNPHQISIYGSGKRPEDVNTAIRAAMPAGCPNPGGNALITDPVGLVAAFADPCNAPRQPITVQFNQPGRYLVICSFNPHFQLGMYGWVIVRDR
jgi:plastocyanin